MIIKSREWDSKSSQFADRSLFDVRTFEAFQVLNRYDTEEILALATSDKGFIDVVRTNRPIEVTPDNPIENWADF